MARWGLLGQNKEAMDKIETEICSSRSGISNHIFKSNNNKRNNNNNNNNNTHTHNNRPMLLDFLR